MGAVRARAHMDGRLKASQQPWVLFVVSFLDTFVYAAVSLLAALASIHGCPLGHGLLLRAFGALWGL